MKRLVEIGLDQDSNANTNVTLKSTDGFSVAVLRGHAFMSDLVKTSLENDPDTSELTLQVKADVLKLVVDYMNHHKGVDPGVPPKPLQSKRMKEVVKDSWDADWIDDIGKNRSTLYALILAANYMSINSLLHLGCAKVASIIKGQPLEKIRDLLDPNLNQSKDDTEVDPKT